MGRLSVPATNGSQDVAASELQKHKILFFRENFGSCEASGQAQSFVSEGKSRRRNVPI